MTAPTILPENRKSSLHVAVALCIVTIAVLLAVGCSDNSSKGTGVGTIIRNVTETTTPIPIPISTENKLAAPICPVERQDPNSILSGDPFVYHSKLSAVNISKNRVWIFGKKTAVMTTAILDRNSSNVVTIHQRETNPLKNGTYEVIIEYPDTSGRFSLASDNRDYPNWVTNQNGDLVLDLSAVRNGGITGKDAANAIEKAITISGINHRTERTIMNVTEAWIRINPIADHVIGDKFPVGGTTNIPAGEIIYLQVSSANYKPTKKSMEGETSSLKYAEVLITPGVCGYNVWGENIQFDTKYWKPDSKIVTVVAEKRYADAQQIFNITLTSTPYTNANISGSSPTTIPVTAL